MSGLDWSNIQIFVAIAEHGSLSAAARILQLTQPTLGRRVRAFEQHLGTQLFLRTASGFELTEAGRTLLSLGKRMEEAALAAEQAVIGRDAGLEGNVRATAPEWLTVRVLSPLVADFCARFPEICVDLVAESRQVSLLRHEADVAFRLARFEEADVRQRHLANVGFGLYASCGYLQAHGWPDFARHCDGHHVITLNHSPSVVAEAPWLGALAKEARVVVRCNGREAQVRLAAAGAGMACLPRFVGDTVADLQLLSPPEEPPQRKLWLGVHSEARHVPRLRAFIDFFSEQLARCLY